MSKGNRYQPEEYTAEYVADREKEIAAHPAGKSDPVNHPSHYKGFSNGAEVIDITENLTGNGAAAVKYLARACRLDGQNKGQVIEDLRKSLWYTQRELDRLGATDA